MRKYGLGYIPDDPTHRKLDFNVFAAFSGIDVSAAPDVASVKEFWDGPRLDQGGNGTCGAHAGSAGVYIALAAAGNPLGWVPSQADLYKLCLCIGRGGPDADGTWSKLEDTGVQPSWITTALQFFGCRPMTTATVKDPDDAAPRRSDCDAASIPDEPRFNDVRTDAQVLLEGKYAITGTASQRGAKTRSALGSKLPVRIGSFVDSKYMEWNSEEPYDRANLWDSNGGGHEQLIVSCRKNLKTGLYEYEIQNSWGDGWCLDGYVWVTENYLESADDLDASAYRRAA